MNETIDNDTARLANVTLERDALLRTVEDVRETTKQLEEQIVQERQRYIMLEEKTKSWKDKVKVIAEHHMERIKKLEDELATCQNASNKPTPSPSRSDKCTLTEHMDNPGGEDMEQTLTTATSTLQARISILEDSLRGRNDVLTHLISLWRKLFFVTCCPEECSTAVDDHFFPTSTSEDKYINEFSEHVTASILLSFNDINTKCKNLVDDNTLLKRNLDQLHRAEVDLSQQLHDVSPDDAAAQALLLQHEHIHPRTSDAITEEKAQHVTTHESHDGSDPATDGHASSDHEQHACDNDQTDKVYDSIDQQREDVPKSHDHVERKNINCADGAHVSTSPTSVNLVSHDYRDAVAGQATAVDATADDEDVQAARADEAAKCSNVATQTLDMHSHLSESERINLMEQLHALEMSSTSLQEQLHAAEQLTAKYEYEISSLRNKVNDGQSAICKLQLRESELAQQVEVKERALSDYQASLLLWKEKITAAKKRDAEEILKLRERLSMQCSDLDSMKSVLTKARANGSTKIPGGGAPAQGEDVYDCKSLLRQLTQIDETLRECLRAFDATDEGNMLDRMQTLLSCIQYCVDDQTHAKVELSTLLESMSKLQSEVAAERDRCLRAEEELRKTQKNSVDVDSYTLIQEVNQQLEQRCELLRKEFKRQRDIYQRERDQTTRSTSSAKVHNDDGSELRSTLRAAAEGVFETGMLSLAELQSQRDNELKTMRSQMQILESQINDLKREVAHSSQVIAAYTKEIEMCRSKERMYTSVIYIRNIILQFLSAKPDTRPKMIPAITTVLEFTPKEKDDVQRANPQCPALH